MLSARQQHCLKGIGIDLWRERAAFDVAAVPPSQVQPQTLPTIHPPAQPLTPPDNEFRKTAAEPTVEPAATRRPGTEFPVDNWQNLEQSINACNNCGLATGCSRKVTGKGERNARLMIIGEAPGRDEDLQGKPFVGRAGQLLDRMLEAIEIDPRSVYITNILKCRPPQNRDPRSEEVTACSQFLQAQIELVKPEIIFSVGRISAQNLLNDSSPVGKLRGRQHCLPNSDTPLLVTYHPAYLLRNAAEKAKVWQDLKALRLFLNDANG
jgi:DNA polymerase